MPSQTPIGRRMLRTGRVPALCAQARFRNGRRLRRADAPLVCPCIRNTLYKKPEFLSCLRCHDEKSLVSRLFSGGMAPFLHKNSGYLANTAMRIRPFSGQDTARHFSSDYQNVRARRSPCHTLIQLRIPPIPPGRCRTIQPVRSLRTGRRALPCRSVKL